jgi:hypothetical protein
MFEGINPGQAEKNRATTPVSTFCYSSSPYLNLAFTLKIKKSMDPICSLVHLTFCGARRV